MNIVLTGATGFVGRQILRAFLASDHNVRVLVRKPDKLESLTRELDVQKTKDLFSESSERLSEMLKGSDLLIHAAWYTEPEKYLESPTNVECLIGTLRLAKTFAALGGKRFVGVGTCFEYDLSAEILPTTTPLAPKTLYAATKASTYQVLANYLSGAGVSFAWCRLFYLLGEGEDEHRLVPTIRRAISECREVELTDGTQIRDYMDVSAAGTEIAQVALSSVSGPVNICSGRPISVRELAERIADVYSARHLLRFGALPPRPYDPPRVVGVKNHLN